MQLVSILDSIAEGYPCCIPALLCDYKSSYYPNIRERSVHEAMDVLSYNLGSKLAVTSL